MAFRDFLPNRFSRNKSLAEQKVPSEYGVEIGYTGTLLYRGIIDEEFNNDLHWPNAGEVYDRMRKGDSTAQAMLAAMKEPLESAKHYVQPASQDKEDLEIADFVAWNLFKRLKGGYKQFFRESLTFLDFGFSVFEICYGIDKGKVIIDRLAPRLQKSILRWTIGIDENEQDWVDGHPTGITQGYTGHTDDATGKQMQPTIPWDKLIVFSPNREGVNFEGVSVLRGAYKHWYYKDLLYKIQSISAERFGVGIPVAKHPTGIGAKQKEKLTELVKNLRSNQQSYAVLDKNNELDILIPKGAPESDSIKAGIDHHDRKMYDSILAGFLNLSTGDGGSNALSVDQSSFYLRGLQSRANFYCAMMNELIKYVVTLNYGEREGYPELCIADIGFTDLVKTMGAIKNAIDSKAVTYTPQDEIHVRGLIGLPSRTVEEIVKDKEEREEKAKEISGDAPPDDGEDDSKDDPEDDKPEPPKKPTKDRKQSAKYTDAIVPTMREGAFVEGITKFEEYLSNKYKEYDVLLSRAESKYREFLLRIYKEADKETRDGVAVFSNTERNKKLIQAAEEGIDEITETLLKKVFIDSDLQKELFTVTQKAALSNIRKISDGRGFAVQSTPSSFGDFDDYDYDNFGEYDEFSEYSASELEDTKKSNIVGAIVGGFVIGYISNVLGVFFNEPRRIKERVSMNFSSQVGVDLAVKQASNTSFNRNIFKLSVITHSRSLYNAILYSAGQKASTPYFKVLIPSNRMEDVDPSGTIAAVLFGIYTASELNNMMNNRSSGSNTSAVNGLGLNYNSFEYYLPIFEEDLETEKEISRQQRKELNLK